MKIALLCSGIGRIQRGFERLFLDLFELVRDDVDITLFTGGGPSSPGVRVVPNASREGRLNRVLPVHRLFGRPPYWSECWSFALAAFPALLRGGYDVVHYIDLPAGRPLAALRRIFRARFRLLYTQGVVVDPRFYPPADHIHQVSDELLRGAIGAGIPAERMTLVPCGIHAGRFAAGPSRAELRERHGIPPDRFVVVSVGALNRRQKRIDHLIAEAERIERPFLLWLDGHPEEPELADLARARLGDAVRVTKVPSAEVSDLYRLADAFVLASVEESFGIVIVEAMAAGLPVVVHDAPHFSWLVGDSGVLADMTAPGALAAAVDRLRRNPPSAASVGAAGASAAHRRFDWSALRPAYLDLYRRVQDGGRRS